MISYMEKVTVKRMTLVLELKKPATSILFVITPIYITMEVCHLVRREIKE